MLGREKDFVFFYFELGLKHSPGKSKRENRENNENLEPKTFTPNTKPECPQLKSSLGNSEFRREKKDGKPSPLPESPG